jgi:hypothetical protein
MQNRMSMPREPHRTTVRRRADGMAQIHVLPPPFSLGALRTFGLGLVGATLLLVALVATPFFVALGARPASPGRGGAPHVMPPR